MSEDKELSCTRCGKSLVLRGGTSDQIRIDNSATYDKNGNIIRQENFLALCAECSDIQVVNWNIKSFDVPDSNLDYHPGFNNDYKRRDV